MYELQCLPDLVLIDILTCGSLNHTDVVNFGCTCKRFNDLASRNFIWKNLTSQRWPFLFTKDGNLLGVASNFNLSMDGNQKKVAEAENKPNWAILFKQIKYVFECVHDFYKKNFSENQIENNAYTVFDMLVEKFDFEFVSEIFYSSILPSCSHTDFTQKYYIRKILHHITTKRMEERLRQLLSQDVDDFSDETSNLSALMKGMIFIEQWFNTKQRIEESFVGDFIAETSRKVQCCYKSILEKDASSEFSQDGTNMLLKSLNDVFFSEVGFTGNRENYYNPHNSMVTNVIKSKTGIPILLSIIYREIAHQVGINLDCINYPGHFMLRWNYESLHQDEPTLDDYNRCFRFIDVFNEGSIKMYSELGYSAEGKNLVNSQPASTHEVLSRVSRNIDLHSMRNQSHRTAHLPDDWYWDALNLCILLMPDDTSYRIRRMSTYYACGVNCDVAMEDNRLLPDDIRQSRSIPTMKETEQLFHELIEKKRKERENYKPEIKLRTAVENLSVKYSIGLVMKHKLYHYVCVVRGWDNFCDMSEGWIQQMGVHRLARAQHQPFYNVLVDKDGSQRYAAEENLELLLPTVQISHNEIGRYFSSYETLENGWSYYHPNSLLQQQYPKDMDVTREEFP